MPQDNDGPTDPPNPPRSIDERLDALVITAELHAASIHEMQDSIRELSVNIGRLDGIAEQNGRLMTQLLEVTH